MEVAHEPHGTECKNWRQIAKSYKHQLARLSNENTTLSKENQVLRELTTEKLSSAVAQQAQLRNQLRTTKENMEKLATIAQCGEDLRACKAELAAAVKEVENLKLAIESQDSSREADRALHLSEQAKLQEEADQKLQAVEESFVEQLNDLKVNLAAANAEKTRLTESLAKHRKEAETLMASLGVPGVSRESGPKRKYHMLALDKGSS